MKKQIKVLFSGYNSDGKWELQVNLWPDYPNDRVFSIGENEKEAWEAMNKTINTYLHDL